VVGHSPKEVEISVKPGLVLDSTEFVFPTGESEFYKTQEVAFHEIEGHPLREGRHLIFDKILKAPELNEENNGSGAGAEPYSFCLERIYQESEDESRNISAFYKVGFTASYAWDNNTCSTYRDGIKIENLNVEYQGSTSCELPESE